MLPVLEVDFFLNSLPGPGHWWVMAPVAAGHWSPSHVVWKSSATTVEAKTAALSALQSSDSSEKDGGKLMSLVCAVPRISRTGKKATP